MKVVHLVTDDIGGAGRAARRIHASLVQQGIDSQVIVLEKYDDNDCHRILNNRAARVLFKIIRKGYQKSCSSKYDIVRFSEPGYGLPLDKLRQVQDADIVHLHWINYSFLSDKALKRLVETKKIVWTLHDMWPFTAGCYYDNECGQYQKGCSRCSLLKKNPDMCVSSWKKKERIFQTAKDLTFVGCSSWITECASKSKLTENFRCITIPNPIDTDIFYEEGRDAFRRKLGAGSEQKVVVFGAMTADSDERKGYKYLIEALKILAGSAQSYLAVVFGNKGEIRSDEFGIQVIGLGPIQDDSILRQIYSAADVFVAPSIQENLSNSVMESLSCATPVTAFNIGGMKDMIEHKVNGYLARPFDPADLAAGIEYSVNHPQMRQKARRKVEETFCMATVGQKYLELYRK